MWPALRVEMGEMGGGGGGEIKTDEDHGKLAVAGLLLQNSGAGNFREVPL